VFDRAVNPMSVRYDCSCDRSVQRAVFDAGSWGTLIRADER
jgi:hypothetical protein